jgi:hypothetical protein
MNNDVPDNHDNKIIQFRPKSDIKKCFDSKHNNTTDSMCPSDWETPYSPTWDELRQTLESLDACYNDAARQLATAGVQSEFTLRERMHDLQQMRGLLLDYFKEE